MPNLEDGFVQIANELWEALCRTRIPGEARQIMDTIIRKTYGYHKKEDMISLSQLSELTGLKHPTICKGVAKLLSMNLITKKDNTVITTYGFNKNYRTWKPLPKKVTLPKKEISQSPKRKSALPKKVDTKDNITKDTFTKEKRIYSREAISYLNEKTGKNYRPVESNLKVIESRLSEGYTLEDCKTVIDHQYTRWHGTKYEQYMRPATLFQASKFDGYLNSPPSLYERGEIGTKTERTLKNIEGWDDERA